MGGTGKTGPAAVLGPMGLVSAAGDPGVMPRAQRSHIHCLPRNLARPGSHGTPGSPTARRAALPLLPPPFPWGRPAKVVSEPRLVKRVGRAPPHCTAGGPFPGAPSVVPQFNCLLVAMDSSGGSAQQRGRGAARPGKPGPGTLRLGAVFSPYHKTRPAPLPGHPSPVASKAGWRKLQAASCKHSTSPHIPCRRRSSNRPDRMHQQLAAQHQQQCQCQCQCQGSRGAG
jgi:hypothetical protein